MDTKNNFDKLNPTLVSLMTSIWAIDKSQEVILAELFDAARSVAQRHLQVHQQLTRLLELRQAKLNSITGMLAREYQRNFEMLKNVTFLKGSLIKTPQPVVGTVVDLTQPPYNLTKRQAELAYREIDTLTLNARALNCLRDNKVKTVGELLALSSYDLKKLHGFGTVSYRSVEKALAIHDLRIGQLHEEKK
jgi:hypothetical protein